MAIYHLEAKVVSRGAGRSAVAASAYLSCSRLYNDYDGIQHDYTKKQGLVWQEVFLPEYAPQEWQDREKLWNAVEEVETAKDSRLAREFVVALPIELNREEQIELLQEFIRSRFVFIFCRESELSAMLGEMNGFLFGVCKPFARNIFAFGRYRRPAFGGARAATLAFCELPVFIPWVVGFVEVHPIFHLSILCIRCQTGI